jgi:hypothetical protein
VLAKTLTKQKFIKTSSKLYLTLSVFLLLLEERKNAKVFSDKSENSEDTEMFTFPHSRFSL